MGSRRFDPRWAARLKPSVAKTGSVSPSSLRAGRIPEPGGPIGAGGGDRSSIMAERDACHSACMARQSDAARRFQNRPLLLSSVLRVINTGISGEADRFRCEEQASLRRSIDVGQRLSGQVGQLVRECLLGTAVRAPGGVAGQNRENDQCSDRGIANPNRDIASALARVEEGDRYRKVRIVARGPCLVRSPPQFGSRGLSRS
jgi:hypothetical protein